MDSVYILLSWPNRKHNELLLFCDKYYYKLLAKTPYMQCVCVCVCVFTYSK